MEKNFINEISVMSEREKKSKWLLDFIPICMLKLIFIDMFFNKLLLSQIEKRPQKYQSNTFNKKSVTLFNAQTHDYGEHMLTRLIFY